MAQIIVSHEGSSWCLHTRLGNTIGSRLLTGAPEPGKDLPELKDEFDSELDARRAALRWNLYLDYCHKKRSKTNTRYAD